MKLEPKVKAGNGEKRTFHVIIEIPRPGLGNAGLIMEAPACGSDDLLFAYVNALLVSPDRRCAADGCYERWPSTPDDDMMRRTIGSPYGRRIAVEQAAQGR